MSGYKKPSWLVVALALSGCASKNDIGLNTYLSAPPVKSDTEENALILVLSEAQTNTTPASIVTLASTSQVKRYLLAGFTPSDIYCDRFFRQTNLAARRRKFTRGAVTDVGGLITTILGLAKAGSGITGGVAAGFTRADSTFRNYDESFLVAPELDRVRSLTLAAQDSYRKETLASANIPTDYMTARSSIVRYARLCSYLGMQELLNRSINQQITALKKDDAPAGAATVTTTVTKTEEKPDATKGATAKPDKSMTTTSTEKTIVPAAEARPNPVPNGRDRD